MCISARKVRELFAAPLPTPRAPREGCHHAAERDEYAAGARAPELECVCRPRFDRDCGFATSRLRRSSRRTRQWLLQESTVRLRDRPRKHMIGLIPSFLPFKADSCPGPPARRYPRRRHVGRGWKQRGSRVRCRGPDAPEIRSFSDASHLCHACIGNTHRSMCP